MITREDVLQAVAESWWEAKPKIIEFVNHHLTKAGARIFTPEHTYFAAHFPLWFGNVIANCPDIGPRSYMISNIYVEEVDDPTIHDTHHGSMVTLTAAHPQQGERGSFMPLPFAGTRPWRIR